MKKYACIPVLLLCFFFSSAQKVQLGEAWTEVGIKATYGVSMIYNKNLFPSSRLSSNKAFGGRLAINFSPYSGIVFEGLYHEQQYGFNSNLMRQSLDISTIKWNTLDTYLLLRRIKNRMYIEFGPVYSFVRQISQTGADKISLDNVDAFYKSNYISGALGFGGYIFGSGTLSTTLGIRLHYGFTDLVSDAGYDNNYPNPNVPASDRTSSNPVWVQVVAELNFGLGYYAKPQCRNRMTFNRKR